MAEQGAAQVMLEASPDEIYDIELEHSLLEANAKLATENRALLDQNGITAIDFMGAIGSGKTTLITKLVGMLKDKIGVAVFNGDATTSNDADAISKQNVPVVQIATINGCHLDANLVGKGLKKIDLGNLKMIFIENIGNLICPAEFPLGSKARVVVVSVTEGPWMVRKHPHMFLGSQVVVINKIDLADAMEVSVDQLIADVHALKPDIKVIPTSCKTGAGLERGRGNFARRLVALIMHEFSIASGLVEKLLDFAEKNPDKKIVEVRVAIGEFTQIEEEQLRFCYESIITEMPIAGSRLTIEPVLGKVACSHCSYSGPPKYWDGALHGMPVATLECPGCGNAARVIEGEECAIRSVRFMPNEIAGAIS